MFCRKSSTDIDISEIFHSEQYTNSLSVTLLPPKSHTAREFWFDEEYSRLVELHLEAQGH